MAFNSSSTLPVTVTSSHDGNRRDAGSYVLNGKIMLCSVVVLFVVLVILVCFHSYARFLFNRRLHRHRHSRATQLFFLSTDVARERRHSHQALDLSVLKGLTTFVYKSHDAGGGMDCAVCLSEFEDDDKGRELPTCKHVFHVDCIDTWFRAHSSCPLCRTPVQLAEELVSVVEPAGSAVETESSLSSSSSSGSKSGDSLSSNNSSPPLDLVSVLVEIPRRDLRGLDDMDRSRSITRGNEFKYPPGNRVLSLKRIWSI